MDGFPLINNVRFLVAMPPEHHKFMVLIYGS